MALKVKYDDPVREKGAEVAVAGLGVLKNGSSVEISEEAERSFLAFHGRTVKDALKGDNHYSVEGTAELKGAAASVPEVSDTTGEKEVND